MVSLWVGIDVGKESFTAWVAGARQPLATFSNSPEGWQQLAADLVPHGEQQPEGAIHLVMEPTGGYEAGLAHYGIEQGFQVSLVNPARVRDWAKSEGRRAKTDRQDARMLADYGQEKKPQAWQPQSREVGELDSLLRRRGDLEGMLRQEKNRKEALEKRPGVARAVPESVGRLIKTLEEELSEIDRTIRELQSQHTRLKSWAELLDSVPGVGDKTVLPLLVLMDRWQTLTRGEGEAKGLVAYVGLDPKPFSSGTSVYRPAAISRMGDRELRRQLVMAALGGTRGNNPLRAFYQGLVDRGKPKMLALVAAARKMLVWAWAVFRRQSPFCPDLHPAKPHLACIE